jgi:SAM-dependent methyltransferase
MAAETTDIDVGSVKAFWEQNPVAAEAIDNELGTAGYFQAFDALREADECEPYDISDAIHGYSTSKGLRVLDVGCGNGYVLYQYARHGGGHRRQLDEAARRVEPEATCSWRAARPIEVDGNSLPFSHNHFDIVCSMGVLDHASNPRPMVDEMFRVLKPGGRLVMLYHRYSWNNLVLLRLGSIRAIAARLS